MSIYRGDKKISSGFRTIGVAINDLYPVGSIYLSTNNVSPATFIGGVWEQIENRFLMGAGSEYGAGTTGGSASHTHTLDNGYAKMSIQFGGDAIYTNEKTVDYYPVQNHRLVGSPEGVGFAPNKAVTLGGTTDSASNMPPYLAVYIWKRIA